jgi:hypothetical protein
MIVIIKVRIIMNKFFISLTILILLIAGVVYGVLFTKTGNNYVASYIEDTVNSEQKDVQLKVNKFTLTSNSINFDATISDNSHINITGDLQLFKQYVDLKYDIKIIELSKLENIINQKLNGSFSTSGTFKGDSRSSVIKGISDIAKSQTSYDVTLLNFELNNVNFLIKDAKIDKLLHLANQPVYASGLLSIDGKIKNTQINSLDGIIKTTIREGKTITSLVNSTFKQNLTKVINFQVDATTSLVQNQAITNSKVKTTLANLDIKKAVFTLNDSSLVSDYLLFVPSLANLYDITTTKMRGDVTIKGNVKSKNKSLFVDGNSKLLGGTLDFNLKNDDLHVDLKSIQVKDLTYMMYYPNVFDSKTALTLDYNLLQQKGKLTGNLIDGQFLANNFSTTLNQLARFDITKEVYDTVNINTNIDKLVLSSTVNMKSKNTQIDITKSILDLEKNTVDAIIKTTIKKAQLKLNVKGDINDPKISFDSKELISNQLNKQIDKNENKIKEKLNKALKGRLGEDGADKVLKSIKSFF